MPISLRQANRFLLTRQHLLQPITDPIQAAIDACGLQAQIPSTPALSLRARVSGFTRADYDRLLKQEKRLVRTWAMRGTVHTLPTERLAQYIRLRRNGLDGYEHYLQADSAQLAVEADLVLRLLAERPASRQELARIAVERGLVTPERAAHLFGPWGGILHYLGRSGHTVHLPDEGRDVRLVRIEEWLGAPLPAEPIEVLEDRLLADYLAGYGPATVHDFAHFLTIPVGRAQAIFDRAATSEDTASLAPQEVAARRAPNLAEVDLAPQEVAARRAPNLAEVGIAARRAPNLAEVGVAARRAPKLAEVELEGSKRKHYLPAALLPELLAMTGEEEAPVHLLPRFDSLLLVHQVKDRFLRPEDVKKVFKPAAVVDATVLVDGWVVGTWTTKPTTKALRFQFHPFRRTAVRPIKAAAARLAAWYGLKLEWHE
ncbi:MAG TPA: crosslink repair DNA glycosylase YcaQ family protein [Symbiobacteriaceae bacterium]|nr:crosslink repair DNA glycosylase YcaQ family protein [Symbiobacteriaceae bacterium]